MSLGQSPDFITQLARSQFGSLFLLCFSDFFLTPLLLMALPFSDLAGGHFSSWTITVTSMPSPPLLVPFLSGSREPVPGPLHLVLGLLVLTLQLAVPRRVAGPPLWLEQVTIGCAVIRTSGPPCTLHVDDGGGEVSAASV